MIKPLISAYECDKDRIVTKLLEDNKKITIRVIVSILIERLVCAANNPYLTTDRMVISCSRKKKEHFFVIRGYKTLGIYSLFVDKDMHNKLLELHIGRTNGDSVYEKYIGYIRELVSSIQIVYM